MESTSYISETDTSTERVLNLTNAESKSFGAKEEISDIPLKTILHFSQKEIDITRSIERQNNKIAQFFVKDIVKAKTYSDVYTEGQHYFEVLGIVFKRVYVRAVIVAIEYMGSKFMITVDDSTASICCFIEEQQTVHDNKKYVEDTLAKISKMNVKDDAALQGGVAFLQAMQNRLKDFLPHVDYELGDTIEFLGRLNYYNGRYYIFINKARIDSSKDVQHDIDYYNNLMNLYKECMRNRSA